MTTHELAVRLMDRMARVREELEEARKLAPNSYGHGYEAGALDTYSQILDLINEGDG